MELIRNSCEIEGTVGIVITRKGNKISEMNMKNTSFPIAAANCFSGVGTGMGSTERSDDTSKCVVSRF